MAMRMVGVYAVYVLFQEDIPNCLIGGVICWIMQLGKQWHGCCNWNYHKE